MTARREILTTRIDGASWSFGYTWQSATSAHSLKSDAAAEACLPSVQADVVALRNDATHAQFGLGYLGPTDRKRGMVAAHAFVTELAKQTIQSAVGLFELPEGYWLVIVADDLIPRDGDRVFSDFDSAMTKFKEHVQKRHWSRIYLPQSLLSQSKARLVADFVSAEDAAFDGAIAANGSHLSTATLAEFLHNVKAPHHRQRTIRRNDLRAYATSRPAVIGAAAAAGLALWLAVPALTGHVTPVPVVKAGVAPLPLRAAPSPVIDTPVPSASSPPPASFLAGCFDQFAALDDRVPWGWEDGVLTCRRSDASAELTRTGGTLDGLEGAYPGATFRYDPTYDNATVFVTHTIAAGSADRVWGGAAALAPAEAARRRLTALGWAMGEKIAVEAFVPPPGRAPGDKATWRQADFSITSDTDILQWGSLLDPVPGLTVSSVTLDAKMMKKSPETVTWQIKGTVYAQ